jgi:phospholipid-binding lipoprotein MlaA
MKPAAKAYRAVTPDVVDRGITNFFANLDDVTSLANNFLQFKLSRAGSDLGRIFINTTVGVLGFVDVATNVGLQSYKEDFDQTLGYWGLEPGAFLMLPILGPSSIRGTLGWAGDIVTDPLFSIETGDVYWGLIALRLVDYRADRLAAGEIMEEAALDPYVFLRDAYLQRRRNLVYDGNPPQAEGEADLWEDVDFDNAPAPKASTPAPPASGQSEHEFPR